MKPPKRPRLLTPERIANWEKDLARIRTYVAKHTVETRLVVAAEAKATDYKQRIDRFFETHVGPFFT